MFAIFVEFALENCVISGECRLECLSSCLSHVTSHMAFHSGCRLPIRNGISIFPREYPAHSIAFDRCQWQWCEITSGFESNPILASSLNGTPWPLHRKLLFSLLEGYCHGDLLDSISWRTINSGNCWCLQIPRAECFHSLRLLVASSEAPGSTVNWWRVMPNARLLYTGATTAFEVWRSLQCASSLC